MQQIAIALCLGLTWSAAAADTLFEAATEFPVAGWKPVSIQLSRAVLNTSPDTKKLLDEEIDDKGLKKRYRDYFLWKPIPISVTGKQFKFVRPNFDPYLQSLYGAHTFHYWIVGANGSVLLTSASDRLAVLSDAHNGMRDLLISQCHGGWCFETRQIFDGRQYEPSVCEASEIANPDSKIPCDKVVLGNE